MMSNMPNQTKEAPTGQKISLNEIADRYLNVYQRLFDIAMVNLAGYRKVSEEDYDSVTNQFPVQPQQKERRSFEAAKNASQDWLTRNLITEALSTIVPLLEDCRTVLALCDYKSAGKNDATEIQKITGKDRQEFMNLPVPDKFKFLKDKYSASSELQEQILSLMDFSRGMIMFEGKATKEICQDGKYIFKIRTITLSQTPAKSDSGEPILGLTRKMSDHTRQFKEGDQLELNKGEMIGSLVTIAGFLATLLASVQGYAKKVGAAS
ncbi:MAG: hypothetical protein AAGA18_05830 [Verrucomicrobiota bacterium]